MQVTPSLHNQVATLAKAEDPAVFALCGFSPDAKIATSVIRVTPGDNKDRLIECLPLNLYPLALLYLVDSANEAVMAAKGALGIDKVFRYQHKGSLYFLDGKELTDPVSKNEVFLEHIFVGLTLNLNSVSDATKRLRSAVDQPIKVFLHDCLEEVFEVSQSSSSTSFTVVKSCED